MSEGHPDKVCDRISDEVVDLFFREARRPACDPGQSASPARRWPPPTASSSPARRAAPEDGHARTQIERRRRARRSSDIGYEQDGFHWKNAKIEVLLHAQSADIAQGVDAAGNKDEGAGDQGIMFGYACRETPELMPAPIYYAPQDPRSCWPTRAMPATASRKLGPDAKSQVTVRYEDGKPVERDADRAVDPASRRDADVRATSARSSSPISARRCRRAGSPTSTVWHVNPTGKFVIGGPDGDCGLTGRKIIVDTYGGAAPHGGGAFSGKDPTKVDRSAAYAARYLAKNVVAAGLADRCTIQLSYAIGVAEPLSVYVDLHGTGKVDEAKLETVLPRGDEPDAARHPRASGPQPADLCPDLGLWPFRPHAGRRRRLLLGEDRSRGRAEARRLTA